MDDDITMAEQLRRDMPQWRKEHRRNEAEFKALEKDFEALKKVFGNNRDYLSLDDVLAVRDECQQLLARGELYWQKHMKLRACNDSILSHLKELGIYDPTQKANSQKTTGS
jgi:hypothetical protein